MRKVKIVLVGSAHTGKTSIVNQYAFGEFTLHTISTTQPAFCQKKLNYRDHELSLEIWDTAGQERYHSLSPLFYRDAEAGIIVFDLTDEDSFTRAQKWITELKQARGDQIHIVVVGNKSDLVEKRVVSNSDAQKLASSIQAPYFETSALTNDNVEPLFNSVCDFIVDKIIANSRNEQKDQKSLKSTIKFQESAEEKSSGGCNC